MLRLTIATLAAISLTACSSEPASEAGDSGAEAAETAQAAETAEEPQLTAEGYGALRIGMTVDEITAEFGEDANPEAVGGPDPESCSQFRPQRAPEGLLLMIEQGVLTRVSIIDPGVETDAGLTVGATSAAVRAAYGEAIQASPHTYVEAPGEYLTVWSTGTPEGPYVQDANARGIRYEVGEDGTVQVIHAGGPSIQYVEGCA
ncbi:hypothetical protein [Parasphingopyxis marina]|uniref:Lipoprotein n=1 Tax=Parasphingopyxis marina TaxID=2761622 RepID=A0A842HYG5_9SPHN|nr:hypothetical protein [Parasphingopyxis marina]MBC2777972.1 hypothetical protein [Parasphingopyxis marina]